LKRAGYQASFRFVRLAAGALVGLHPWCARVRERTGAAVVAVEWGQDVFVEFNNAFQVRSDDVLFVCGTLASLDQFVREFQTASVESPRV
jgi:uncharacterized protein with PhoU and TrkA domain